MFLSKPRLDLPVGVRCILSLSVVLDGTDSSTGPVAAGEKKRKEKESRTQQAAAVSGFALEHKSSHNLRQEMASKSEDVDDIYPDVSLDVPEYDNTLNGSARMSSPANRASAALRPTNSGYSRVEAGPGSIARYTENVFNRQSSYVNALGARSTVMVNNARESLQTVGKFFYRFSLSEMDSNLAVFLNRECERFHPRSWIYIQATRRPYGRGVCNVHTRPRQRHVSSADHHRQ
jgi:hypothetical protein